MKHLRTKFIRTADNQTVGPDQAFSKEGMLKPGFTWTIRDQADRASDKEFLHHENKVF